jgi:hypothetical protein
VRFLQSKLLLIGFGKWPEKIKSVLAAQDATIDILVIPARKFLDLDLNTAKELLRSRLVWIATTPDNQFRILERIKRFENKVIIEKPFASNLRELDLILTHSSSSKNKLYVSEPWRHSQIWQVKKLDIESTSGKKNILINRGGPVIRDYITPAWDWMQHDIGLLSDLLDSKESDLNILASINQNEDNFDLKIECGNSYDIKVNAGYISQRCETWHLNNELLINFGITGILTDHPLYNMFKFVSDENFISNLETQLWLFIRVIKCLEKVN